jgi:hypothetical protein
MVTTPTPTRTAGSRKIAVKSAASVAAFASLALAATAGAPPSAPSVVKAEAYTSTLTRAVTIGNAKIDTYTYPVAGVNIERATDALVVFTRAGGATVSPANQWGVEVAVMNGVVTKVTDRQTTGGTGAAIPDGGLLLSGHGKARDWLLLRAKVGKTVTLPAGVVPAPPTPPPAGVWLSGAAGTGVADGTFGTWRGTPVKIAGTWNDSFEAQTEQWSILPGAEFGAWTDDIDDAVGAIYQDRGETWAAAATGAYDSRWTASLNKIKTARTGKTGTVHIRFAHEFNGDWVPWKVTGTDTANFIASWKRFRSLQKTILPSAKLVFCPNDGTSSSLSLDWRNAFPGAAYVDEMAVDSYNQYPYVDTSSGFTTKINSTDSYGAPVGIEKHRLYAASVGLPLAISEWNTNASMGDSNTFVTLFHDWVAANAGTSAGKVPYEIVFNVPSFGTGQFSLFPTNTQPLAAAAYVAGF